MMFNRWVNRYKWSIAEKEHEKENGTGLILDGLTSLLLNGDFAR